MRISATRCIPPALMLRRSRKFTLPHYPHSLKWKLIPGDCYVVSTARCRMCALCLRSRDACHWCLDPIHSSFLARGSYALGRIQLQCGSISDN